MIILKYTLSVLLYILLLPISTPAAFIVSTWTRPDDLDWGVGLVDQLNLKAPISDTITRAEYQLLFAKVASVETLLMSLVGSIYVT